MSQNVVNDFFIQFGTQSDWSQWLSLTTGKDGWSVRSGQVADFTPDRANFSSLTSIQTFSFIKDTTTHGLFFYVMVITINQCTFFFQLFFGELSFEFVTDSVESILTFMFVSVSGSCDGIRFIVAGIVNGFAEFFVVFFVTIFTFYGFTNHFSQFHLCFAMYFDSFVSYFHCFQQFGFWYFAHFTFYHHDVFISSGNHDVHISFFKLVESRVDNELAINTRNTYFRNRSVERNIWNSKCCWSCKSGQCIGHINTVCWEKDNVYVNFCVEIIGE